MNPICSTSSSPPSGAAFAHRGYEPPVASILAEMGVTVERAAAMAEARVASHLRGGQK